MAQFRVIMLPPHRAQLRGLGQETEIPEIRPLPWDLNRGPDTKQARMEKLAAASTVIALIGGALGIAQAIR